MMKAVSLLAACAVLVSAHMALAADCAKFNDALDRLDRQASYMMVSNMGDDSVYRAILKEQQKTNLNARRQMDLQLMQSAKCPLPAFPISDGRYVSAALTCAADEIKDTSPASCKQESWKPDSGQ